MNTNEITANENKQSALTTMVEKLDSRQRGSLGYVTTLPELQAILSQLTPRVSVAHSGVAFASGSGWRNLR